MRRALTSALCASLLPVASAWASAPIATVAPAADALDNALDAWRRGDWAKVRGLLEPAVRDGGSLETEDETETALRHLADATLLDESLDAAVSHRLATEYVERLLDRDVEWRPPPDTHSAELEDLVEQVRAQRRQVQAENCAIERTSCQANLQDLRSDHENLEKAHADLEIRFRAQDVTIQEREARNRAVALVPFGVGHFYNRRPGLAAAFLAGEVAFGATGLALLLTRTLRYNCVREAGFSEGSVVCAPPDDLKAELGQEGTRTRIEQVRNAEQTFGIMFIGALVVDVVVAQATFKPYEVVKTRTVPRSELDADKRGPGEAKPRKRGKRKPSAKIRPTIGPGSVGVDIRF